MAATPRQENDLLIPNPPKDSISSISLNGTASVRSNLLVATSWDNSVSCYELQYSGTSIAGAIPRYQMKHDAPVLCSDFNTLDNCTVYSGGCDNVIKMWNVVHGSFGAHGLGVHDEPIRCLKFLPERNIVISGSWDKKIKLWDPRQSAALATITLSDKVYAMDAKSTIMVIGTADQEVYVYDMIAGNNVAKFKSPLQYQTRCISIFADMKGFAVGCIEGRIGLEYFDELANKTLGATSLLKTPSNTATTKPKNFSFKCHRDGNNIYCVNAITFHPFNTFASCGSDGVIALWDKTARQRLVQLEKWKLKCPITDIHFTSTGEYLAYSVSYDWSKGKEHYDPKMENNIYLHKLDPMECTPKQSTTTIGK